MWISRNLVLNRTLVIPSLSYSLPKSLGIPRGKALTSLPSPFLLRWLDLQSSAWRTGPSSSLLCMSGSGAEKCNLCRKSHQCCSALPRCALRTRRYHVALCRCPVLCWCPALCHMELAVSCRAVPVPRALPVSCIALCRCPALRCAGAPRSAGAPHSAGAPRSAVPSVWFCSPYAASLRCVAPTLRQAGFAALARLAELPACAAYPSRAVPTLGTDKSIKALKAASLASARRSAIRSVISVTLTVKLRCAVASRQLTHVVRPRG